MFDGNTGTSTPVDKSQAVQNLSDLRRHLNQMFDDAGFDAFCLDHFPEIYEKFSRGMRKDEKITLLLDHCRRNSEGYKLLAGKVWEYTPFQRRQLQRYKERLEREKASEAPAKPSATALWLYATVGILLLAIVGVIAYLIPAGNSESNLAIEVSLPETISFNPVPVDGGVCLDVFALTGDEQDIVWAGTNHGIWQSIESEMLRPFPGTGTNLETNEIYALYRDEGDNLWAGADNGLWLFSGGQWQAVPGLAGLQIVTLSGSADQSQASLWAGTFNGKVIGLKYPQGSPDALNLEIFYRETIITDLDDEAITGLVVDSEGRVWIGSYGKGVGIYDGINWVWQNQSTEGLPNNYVTVLAQGQAEQIWVGTFNGSYTYWDSSESRWSTALQTEFKDPIVTFAFGPTSLVWIGNQQSGVAGLRNKVTKYYKADKIGLDKSLCPTTEINVLYAAEDILWLGGISGLWQLKNDFSR